MHRVYSCPETARLSVSACTRDPLGAKINWPTPEYLGAMGSGEQGARSTDVHRTPIRRAFPHQSAAPRGMLRSTMRA